MEKVQQRVINCIEDILCTDIVGKKDSPSDK